MKAKLLKIALITLSIINYGYLNASDSESTKSEVERSEPMQTFVSFTILSQQIPNVIVINNNIYTDFRMRIVAGKPKDRDWLLSYSSDDDIQNVQTIKSIFLVKNKYSYAYSDLTGPKEECLFPMQTYDNDLVSNALKAGGVTAYLSATKLDLNGKATKALFTSTFLPLGNTIFQKVDLSKVQNIHFNMNVENVVANQHIGMPVYNVSFIKAYLFYANSVDQVHFNYIEPLYKGYFQEN